MRGRVILRWAALGALSGTLATLAIFIPDWLDIHSALAKPPYVAGIKLAVSPLSVAPGLVFGLVIGYALRRKRLLAGGRYAAYILAAGLSYFVTVQLVINILMDLLDNAVAAGVVAGAIGAALLAGATAALIPDFRRRRPMIAMTLSGAVLGAALFFFFAMPGFFGWLLLFAPWQAGYAAAMATVPED